LTAGRLDEAAAQFAQRVHASNSAAESKGFVEAYSRMALQLDYAAVEQGCTPEIGSYASHEKRFGANFPPERISAILDEYGQSLPGSMRARLELCHISSLLPLASEKVHVRNLIDRQFKSVTTQWTSDEKSWLSYLALRDHLDSDEAKYKAPPRHLDEIRSLLAEAIRGFPTKTAETVFYELRELCD
jgi:hypothetical protein